MTPNNILNMAMLKGLDFISITDHNSTKQLKVFEELIDSYDFVFIPGCEVTVIEGFDVLCYFQTFEDAYTFDKFLESNLTDNWNNYTEEDQMITNIYDLPESYFDKSLQSTTITYKTLYHEVKRLNGIIIPAHIDRRNQTPFNSYKLEEISFDGLEVQKFNKGKYLNDNPNLNNYNLIFNSDSHTLLSISEKEESIELESKTLSAFFAKFRGEV